MLEPFVDGELPTADQVAVQSHLRSCQTCATHVEDIALIGWSVRVGTPATSPDDADARSLAILQSGVLTRIRAERAQALKARLAEMFSDMRLFWPALGATAAVFACLVGAVNVWRLTMERQPGSVAAMLEILENPGSERNPLRIENGMSVPRLIDDAFPLEHGSDDEAVIMAKVILTRDGRVGSAELLGSPRLVAGGHAYDEVLDAVKELQFEPSKKRGGVPVAVTMVLRFEQTLAVKETARGFGYTVPASSGSAPAVAAPVAKPSTTGTRSSIPRPSATA
jgi:hypothetical protein